MKFKNLSCKYGINLIFRVLIEGQKTNRNSMAKSQLLNIGFIKIFKFFDNYYRMAL